MSDWTTDAADAIENAVGMARERTVEPARAVAKAITYGLLAALLARPGRRAARSPGCSAP